jgi:hypothetical protein
MENQAAGLWHRPVIAIVDLCHQKLRLKSPFERVI